MAAINTAAVSGWLKRQYAKKSYFEPFQNDLTPILNDLDECPDESPEGSGWFVPLYLQSGRNWRAGTEGSAMADVVAASVVQGQVNAQEFKGTVQLTEFLKLAGSARGHFNGGALALQMKSVTTDVTQAMQRFFVIGHTTGRLAVVDADVVSGNTFLARLPISIHNVEINDRVDFVDTDTGGTVQVSNRQITAIDKSTRGITGAGTVNTYAGTVTFNGAATGLTAGWGVYRSGDYGGNITNGIRGLVQNGDISSSFLGQTYASFPGLKSQVKSNGGTPRDISEDLARQICDDIYHSGKIEVAQIYCNTGVMNAWAGLSVNDRRYNVMKGEFPKYIQGWKEGDLLFAYDKATAVIKKDPNIPAREMYFLNLKESFYKHTLAELDFLSGGRDGVLRLTPNGSGYETSWTAIVYAACNISCYYPVGNGVIRDITDAGLAGD